MSDTGDLLGHELFGEGPSPVVVMNDWMCDTSTWDSARGLMDVERFTWAFVDLRGYGLSRGRAGLFTLAEATDDVLALASALGWTRFAVVGHSMSSLVALHLAQRAPERVSRIVAITPPPPASFGADDATLAAMRGLARGDDATRLRFAVNRPDIGRLGPGWARFKIDRWRASSDPEAVEGYITMFARDGLPSPTARVAAPVLAITGEHDVPPMRRTAVEASLSPLAAELTIAPFADSGHYPMQEAPPLTVATIERFLAP